MDTPRCVLMGVGGQVRVGVGWGGVTHTAQRWGWRGLTPELWGYGGLLQRKKRHTIASSRVRNFSLILFVFSLLQSS